MFGNLVNRHDVSKVVEIARSGRVLTELKRVVKRRSGRVDHAWSQPQHADQWWAIEAVSRRWRSRVCGHPDVDVPAFLSGRYLGGRAPVTALMVGCGAGHSLARWMQAAGFQRLDAFDVAGQQVARAEEHVRAYGLTDRVRVYAGDVASIPLPAAAYDVVIAEQALHHMTPLDAILRKIVAALRPAGLLFLDEFVGPNRHQWTPRQLDAGNALLGLLPERYRRRIDGTVKRRVVRPSVARMLLSDPSEAVESAHILPCVERALDVLEVHTYGGALLEPVLSGIAHNFVGDDPVTRQMLEMCFAAEDALLAAEELENDFVVVVGRRPD